ncbi:MAG: hypothetical protein KGO81_09845 [Bacteroidota bacterium]|nr:hypothetical protein [Bacteroidota bacterium]
MKTITILLTTICILNIYSCSKNTGTGDFYSSVQIHYIDKNGYDLFGNGQNGYIKDSVNVFDISTGIEIPLPISSQKYYFADWAASTIVIDGSINNHVVNHYTYNIIHLKAGVDDTLKIHLTKNTQYGALYDSIWYNGALKKDSMTIIK